MLLVIHRRECRERKEITKDVGNYSPKYCHSPVPRMGENEGSATQGVPGCICC